MLTVLIFLLSLTTGLVSTQQACPVVNENDILKFFNQNSAGSSWIRPVKNFNESVGLMIDLSVRNVVDLDERKQELYIRGYIYLQWYDQFRVWNNTFPLNCMDTVSLPFGKDTKIWTPSIMFSNSQVF